MEAIVQHHANAIGVGYDATKDDEETADRLLEQGRKTVFWEGSAHVAAQFPLGARLRAQLGDGYRAVHVTFGSGVVAGVSVPPPPPGRWSTTFSKPQGSRWTCTRARPGSG